MGLSRNKFSSTFCPLLVAVVLLFVFLVPDADARRRRRSRGYSYTTYSVDYSIWAGCTTDQEKCEAEANYMAKHHAYYHVGPNIGSFEGWGVGGAACATCTPGWNAALTGDAWARSSAGVVFRVRSWR